MWLSGDVRDYSLTSVLYSYFYGRIAKEAAEAAVLSAGNGAYLLRWSGSMAGVHFVVLSERDGTRVRHVRLERAEAAGGRGLAVQMPAQGGVWERRLFDSVAGAVEAMRGAYRMVRALGPSPYYRGAGGQP